MKTLRVFVASAACVVGLTIATALFTPLVSRCGAETLPVLRLDPRMGDPDEPGFRRQLPFDNETVDYSSTIPVAETQSLGPAGSIRGWDWITHRQQWWLLSYLALGRR
jgi:hypothetical protein